MTDTANSGDGWTQLPVVRLKDDTVMRIADDIGIASHELLSVVVVKTSSAGDGQEPKHPSFISTAPKDVVVEYRPEGHDYIEYEGSRQNPEDICAHFVREVKESIEKKRPYMTIYTLNPHECVRECAITTAGKQTVFKCSAH